MADQPKVKGVAFRSVYESLETLRGPGAQKLALAAMSESLRRGFEYGSIVSSGWYDIALYRELLAVVRRSTNTGKDFIYEIGRQCTRSDMSGIYKVLAKVISPGTLFSLSQRVFSSYYSVGKVTIVESRVGFTHARWEGCVGFDDNMWAEVMGSCEQLLEIGGARNVRQRVVGGGGSEEWLELTAHWS